MSIRHSTFVVGIAITMAASSSFFGPANAAHRVTRAEAWRLCKATLDHERVPGTLGSNERYLRGGACLAKYGYRL